MIGIYAIKNKINGKMYVGQSVNIKKRWYMHKRKLKMNIHHNNHLQYSWNKYGEQSFEFKVLIELESKDEQELNTLEKNFIKKFNTSSNKFGFNKTEGGHNGRPTDEVLLKISETISHKKLTNGQAQEVFNMLIEGYSTKQLSKKFNVEEYVIKSIKFGSYKFIDRKGFSFEKKKQRELSDEEVTGILNDFHNGEKIKDILEKYNIGRKILNSIRENRTFKYIDKSSYNLKTRLISHHYEKLTDDLVIESLELLSKGKKLKDVSDKLNIAYNDLKDIKDNKIFKHIDRSNFFMPKVAKKRNLRFSDEEVIDILNRLNKGEKIKDICSVYGYENANIISKIKNGYLYKHIQRIGEKNNENSMHS